LRYSFYSARKPYYFSSCPRLNTSVTQRSHSFLRQRKERVNNRTRRIFWLTIVQSCESKLKCLHAKVTFVVEARPMKQTHPYAHIQLRWVSLVSNITRETGASLGQHWPYFVRRIEHGPQVWLPRPRLVPLVEPAGEERSAVRH